MESPHPRVWGVLLALAELALLVALRGDGVGPRHLAAMRARAAELGAKQDAAREVVRRAAERWPDDPERMWAESRSAQWLSAEEWAELLELRERLGELAEGPAGSDAREVVSPDIVSKWDELGAKAGKLPF